MTYFWWLAFVTAQGEFAGASIVPADKPEEALKRAQALGCLYDGDARIDRVSTWLYHRIPVQNIGVFMKPEEANVVRKIILP